MKGQEPGRGLECVIIDLNTQVEFCGEGGAFLVSNRDQLVPALRRVVAWAKRNCVPVVSAIGSCRARDVAKDPQSPRCIDGTAGQRKLDFTLFGRCARIELDNTLALPENLFNKYQQVIFRKREDDLMGNPKADRFLTQLDAREYILFGNGLEDSVKALALSLFAREKSVTVVVDACGYWHMGTAEFALRQLAAKRINLITVDELLRRKLSRERRDLFRPHAHDHDEAEEVDSNEPAGSNRIGEGLSANGNGSKNSKSAGRGHRAGSKSRATRSTGNGRSGGANGTGNGRTRRANATGNGRTGRNQGAAANRSRARRDGATGNGRQDAALRGGKGDATIPTEE